MNKVNSPRIYGFDILRIATVMAILYFHVWQYTFFQDVISLPPEISNYHNLTGWVGDTFKYGGLFIVALSFFLIGLKKSSGQRLRFFILLFGLWALQIMTADEPSNPSTWSWDVYSYLLVSYLVVLILPKSPVFRWILIPISIVTLSIPYEQYGYMLGIPETPQFVGWNLMPWLALPILYHSIGILWGEKIPGLLYSVKKWEWPIWISAIAVVCYLAPDYGSFPAGPGFEGYIFKQKPLMFWQHFLIFSFLMRISLDVRVNQMLGKIQGMQWFSNLAWNKHLGAAYFMHLAFLPMGQRLMDLWAEHPRMFEWLWLFIFICVEIIVRFIFHSRTILRSKGIKMPF